jgi:hypothetical protein
MYIDAFAARSAAPVTKHARTAQSEGADASDAMHHPAPKEARMNALIRNYS